MRTPVRRTMLLTATAIATLSAMPAMAQPVPPDGSAAGGFVLFADEGLRTKGLQAHGGTIAVNQGELAAVHGALVAPESDVVADSVRLDRGSQCAALFSNDASKTSPGCSNPQPFSSPVVADFAAACGYPSEFPTCSPNVPVTVEKGESRTLPPGNYGELRLKNDAVVHFGDGTYVFCKISVSRRARILTGAATVQVVGDVRLNNEATIGQEGDGLNENDTVLQVAGRSVHFSRQTKVDARLCAPNAALSLGTGGVHHGCFAASTIQVSRADVTVCSEETPTTTTTVAPTTSTTATSSTTTSTTSTTTIDVCAGNHCGDGIINCGEVCDPAAAPIACSSATGTFVGRGLIADSPGGGFLTCIDNCTVLDDSQCTLPSTTTTSAPSTSTSTIESTTTATASTSTSTSTTTTDPCTGACGNGTVDGQCGEVCDTALPATPCGSPQGAFITCVDNCTALDSSACTATVAAETGRQPRTGRRR